KKGIALQPGNGWFGSRKRLPPPTRLARDETRNAVPRDDPQVIHCQFFRGITLELRGKLQFAATDRVQRTLVNPLPENFQLQSGLVELITVIGRSEAVMKG